MCLGWFRYIDPVENHFGLSFFVADALNGKSAQPQAPDNEMSKEEVA